jgi:hypothetical protein
MRVLGLAVAGLLLVVAPSVDAAVSAPIGPTPTTLYFHLLDVQHFPINTQPPQMLFERGPAVGLATHTLSCLPNPPAGGTPFMDSHSWYGFSTPTYVEYDFMQEGRPRYNAWRGLSWDIPVDASAPATLHWYLAQESPLEGADAAPVPVPNVVVQATLREPDAISPDDSAYDTGPALAHGRSAPAILAGEASQGVRHAMVDGQHVYAFTVPLAFDSARLPRATGYTVRVDAYIESDACDPGTGGLMPTGFAPFMHPDHLPRIELTVQDPLRIEGLKPGFVNGTVLIEADFASAWGAYDVDEGNITLEVVGPQGTVAHRQEYLIQRTHEWGHFLEPVRAAWTLPDSDALPPGLYNVTLVIQNDQKTATAFAQAAFSLDPDVAYPAPEGGGRPRVSETTQAMPAPTPVLVLGLLLLGLAVRRRFGNG